MSMATAPTCRCFLFVADLLVLRDGVLLLMVLPPSTLAPEGHRLDAIALEDRASLPPAAARARTDCWTGGPQAESAGGAPRSLVAPGPPPACDAAGTMT